MPYAPETSESVVCDRGDNDQLFQDEEDMRRCLARLCYGDLYIIGKIWIGALQSVLVGAKLSLIPVVRAEKCPPEPPRPPPMKYTDLPVYTTPHYDYKTHLEDKLKCPGADEKILQSFLYPHVRSYRKCLKDSISGMTNELILIKNEICAACCKKQTQFKCFMRHPDNVNVRQAAVVLGGLTGFYVGRGNNFPKKMFFTTLGTLATGALCFPKETDEIFRTAIFNVGKGTLAVYNAFCAKTFSLREKMPCNEDIPSPPKPRQVTKCPPQK